MNNSSDNVAQGLSIRPEEAALFQEFLRDQDFSAHTQRAVIHDLREFCQWHAAVNGELFDSRRVATVDVSGFRDSLRREKMQAVATVNRALCSVRKYLNWLVAKGHLLLNPAKGVKELRRQGLAPKGLNRREVRKLLREVELRSDLRAGAVFSLFLFTGCRVSDLIQLEFDDLEIGERSGSVTFRYGKGNKQRSVPLPLPARRALQHYMAVRPPADATRIFIGERGPLTARGVRSLCEKYSKLLGFHLHPHLLRHTFAKQFLADTQNDLVALAQILGHSNINTTSRYSLRSSEDLRAVADRLSY